MGDVQADELIDRARPAPASHAGSLLLDLSCPVIVLAVGFFHGR
jgi:hypothetical protein